MYFIFNPCFFFTHEIGSEDSGRVLVEPSNLIHVGPVLGGLRQGPGHGTAVVQQLPAALQLHEDIAAPHLAFDRRLESLVWADREMEKATLN